MDYILKNTYHAAIMLAITLGFDNVEILNNQYIFTSSQNMPICYINKEVIYNKVNSNFQNRYRGNRDSIENSLNILFNKPSPSELTPANSLQLKSVNINMQTNNIKQLVPFSLNLPTENNLTYKTLYLSLKIFFNKIINLVNNKNNIESFNNYNIKNLNRLFTCAQCFLNSTPKNLYNNFIYEPLYASLYNGIEYNNIIYLGSIRSLNFYNAHNNNDNFNLLNYIENNANKIINCSVLSNFLLSNEYIEITNHVLKCLKNNEYPYQNYVNNLNIIKARSLKETIFNKADNFINKYFPIKEQNNFINKK